MTSRRVPLATVPNATNSPYRAVATAAGKRQRSYASDQRELAYGQPPPAKKQIIEVDDAESRRNPLLRGTGRNPPNAFTRKLEAIRDGKPAPKPVERVQKATSENLETIRQWQKHYRRAFPGFVFYFESIPEDARIKATRQIQALGAREEKFFSRAVTHVVTTRPIPKDTDTSSSTDARASASAVTGPQDNNGQMKTINPSLLDRTAEMHKEQKNRYAFDVALQKKLQTQAFPHDVELRKQQTNTGDILYKAKEMGMKIWALEKLNRMMTTMFNTDTGEQPSLHARGVATAVALRREADLGQLLQNEKLNGPADRDFTVATQEMTQFRGYYIYIHDMDEKTRPVMVRDYPKPATKEEGKWPQFRLTGPGRCPFVEDPSHNKRVQLEQQKQKAEARAERVQAVAPRTRAAAALEAAKQRAPAEDEEKAPLAENNNLAGRPSAAGQTEDTSASKPLDPPKVIPAKRANPDSMPPLFGSAQASLRAMPRFAGGEPVASGVQPSNITSAIRSQMISSTAAAPGARAGTSKEVHQLKRKVLEKNSAPSANSMPSSYMNDVRGAINNDRIPPSRAAKRKAQETLTGIQEDVSEEEEYARKQAVVRRKKSAEKECKAGYCENCREKFNDFDEHVMSRKHRKFALTPDNWAELDDLLSKLVRPLKAELL